MPDQYNVLIIEDDPSTRKSIVKFLNDGSVKVQEEWRKRDLEIAHPSDLAIYECRNQEEAINWLDGIKAPQPGLQGGLNPCPDLVLLDLQIPIDRKMETPERSTDLYGFQILDYIRINVSKRIAREIPVIVLSANIGPDLIGTGHGLDQLKRKLDSPNFIHPDDVLAKTSRLGGTNYLSADGLWSKIAPYFISLDANDQDLLEKSDVFCGVPGSTTWRVLCQLKRHARSFIKHDGVIDATPLPDILLYGETGVGKSTIARAYHLLRQKPGDDSESSPGYPYTRLGFHREDFASQEAEGSAVRHRLFGCFQLLSHRDLDWTMGAFIQTTFYIHPGGERSSPFEGQYLEDWKTGKPIPSKSANESPVTSLSEDHSPNCERSGTLFLDEIAHIDPKTREMLLQILGSDRRKRFVNTTGSDGKRVAVSPAIIMAIRRTVSNMTEGDMELEETFLSRIDPMRIYLPPLTERRDEILPYLRFRMKRLWKERSPPMVIDPVVESLLSDGPLDFVNNFADLNRILDRVSPEEDSITFRHIISPARSGHPAEGENGQGITFEECKAHLDQVLLTKKTKDISQLKREYGLPSTYRIVLAFLHRQGFTAGNWPTNEKAYLDFFGMNKKTFEKAIDRLYKDPNRSTSENLLPDFGEGVEKDMLKFCR